MGPIKTPQSSHDNNPRSPPPQDANMEDKPPLETYPPQPEPVQFPPQQTQTPVQFPPQPEPVQFPPQPEPVPFPPQPQPVPFPPQPQPVPFPPQPQPVPFPPQPQPVPFPPPRQQQQQQPPVQEWKHNDLFGCAEDPENAIITAFFPCITFGQIAEVVDNGQTSCATSGLIYGVIAAFIGIPCIMSCSYRTKIRNRYGLMETPAPDWVTHCFCEWCALCQEYRELKARGLDPAIGWQGNMERNQQQYAGMAMNPPMNQRMM